MGSWDEVMAVDKKVMGRRARLKGARFEREVVALFEKAGVPAKKVPGSGGARGYKGDVQTALFEGRKVECKDLKSGLVTIEKWLADADYAVSNRSRKCPLVHMTWDTFEELIKLAPKIHEPEDRPEENDGPHGGGWFA